MPDNIRNPESRFANEVTTNAIVAGDQARVNAVRAAREKATLMAAELGATISAVKSIGETSYGAEPAANMTQSYTIVVPANNAWNDDGSFAAGLIHITASVDVVFYLATQKWMTDRLHGALPRTAADIQNLLVRNKIHGTFLDE